MTDSSSFDERLAEEFASRSEMSQRHHILMKVSRKLVSPFDCGLRCKKGEPHTFAG